MDRSLLSAVTEITNTKFTEANWAQATLPTRYGGLGLRRTEDVALPSFMASLNGCRLLISALLTEERYAQLLQQEYATALDAWEHLADGARVPEEELKSKQKSWDGILSDQQFQKLLLEANQFTRARLLSARTSESGAWLRAIPSTSLGTHLDDDALRVAVALRVGADVCIPHKCRCGSNADTKGFHALTCRFSAGRHPRHTALNDIIRRSLQSAGLPSILEPSGLDRGDGKRPDGMSIFPFSKGKSLVWDATCVNTYAASNIGHAAASAGAAATEAEEKKRKKYEDLVERFQFQPVAFETGGACGLTTRAFILELGSRLSAVSGDRRETEWLLQRLSLAIVRGNAASILLAPPAALPQFDLVRLPGTPMKRVRSTTATNGTAEPLSRQETPVSRLAKFRAMFKEMAGRSPRQDFDNSGPANEHPRQDASPSRDPMADPELAKYLRH
ncbi:MAG: hypothetical protein AAFP03_17310, partial [Cyanobacteria bacterium J06598_3]